MKFDEIEIERKEDGVIVSILNKGNVICSYRYALEDEEKLSIINIDGELTIPLHQF